MTDAALGMLIGAGWNLASVWCLTRLLRAWLNPPHSRRRVIGWSHHLPLPPEAGHQPSRLMSDRRSVWQVVGWLLVKFPALYTLAFILLQRQLVSPLWFGVGFTASLIVVLIWFAIRLPVFSVGTHGR